MIGKNRIDKNWTLIFTIVFLVIAFSNLSCKEVISRGDPGEEKQQDEHPASAMIPNFHLYSYYAGTISTSTEFVSYGCKKLALSATMSDEELAVLLPHAEQKAEEYGIPIYVEKDLLVTPLFSPTIALGKTVILFAYNQDVLDEYFAIKAFREKAVEVGRLRDVEEELAWRFGRLLSYTDDAIERLLSEEK